MRSVGWKAGKLANGEKGLLGRSSFINGGGTAHPRINREKKGRKIVLIVALGIILMLLATLQKPLSVPHGKSSMTYALVELKTPGIMKMLKDSGAKIIHNYGYYALVQYPATITKAHRLPIHDMDYRLFFQTGKFKGDLEEIPSMFTAKRNTKLYVVQMIGPPTIQWIEEIKAYGKIYRYVPNYGYIIRVRDTSAVNNLKQLSFVRDVYPYEPLWKLMRNAYKVIQSGNNSEMEFKINILPDTDIKKAVNEIATKYDGKIIKYFSYPKYNYAYIVAKMKPSMLVHLLQEDFVDYVGLQPKYRFWNADAARVTGVWAIRHNWWNGLGYPITGSTQVVAIADTGLDSGDPDNIIPDFAGRVLTIYDAAGDNDPSDPDNDDLGGHGTHVAGSVASSGVMSGSDPANHYYDGSYAGMAPEAKIHFESIGKVSIFGGGLSYDSITNMADRSYQDGARVWTNSWGSSDNSYTDDSDEVDKYMWNHKDFLILFAAGNSGPDANTVGSPATAKNIITVGAAQNLDPHVNSQGTWNAYSMSSNMWTMAYFSSRGPTADGLIKPDVCAPGAGIVSDRPSTLSDSNAHYTWIVPIDSNGDGKYDYGAMQGTSMATPIAAGIAVLVRDYLTKVDKDYDPVTGDVNISAALVKAIMIGGAEPMPGYKYHGIDQGYGRINIAHALIPEPPLSYRYWDWQNVSNGKSVNYTVYVKTSEAPLRIVLVWTDVNSGSNAGIAQNNLDLRVIAPNGTEYHGERFVGDTQWSKANPTDYDSKNVTEVVNVKNPEVGTWTIQVIGASIGTDDPDPHAPGSQDQSFALYALGPFGNYSFGPIIKMDRYVEHLQTTEYKNFTNLPVQKVLPAGMSTTVRFRIVNWGNQTDTYNFATQIIPSTTDISVSYSPSSVTLDPGEIAWINATIQSKSTTNPALYELRLMSKSSVNSNVNASIIVNLQIVNPTPVWHTQITNDLISKTSSAVAIDPTDNSIWVAYFRQNTSTTGNTVYPKSGNGDNYDLMVAHSTDGGVTWTIYNVHPNFYRYFDYKGSLEQIMDWFYWYPSIDVDSNGVVFISFATGTHVEVQWGNESGWNNKSFEAGKIYTQGASTYYLIAYPWTKVYCDDAHGTTWVFYTWLDTKSDIRDLREVHTTDGGATWNGPNSIDSTGDSDDRRYFPAAVEFGGKLWVFVSQRLAGSGSDSDYYIAYNTYDYSSGKWGSFTTLFGTGSDGYHETYPSAFVDSSGRLWVAWYSDDDQQNAHFGVAEHAIYVNYTDDGTTWHGPIKLNESTIGSDINDFGPIGMGEDNDGNIWITFLEENSNYTSAPHNDNWTNYRYSIKAVLLNRTDGSIVGTKYIDYGGTFIMHPAACSYKGTVYISYTKNPEFGYPQIYLAKYNSTATDNFGPDTYSTAIFPPNTNNASKIIYIDLVYVKNLNLTATISDVESGNSTIAGAEYFVDSIGDDGSGTAMNAADGAFDSSVESVYVNIDPFSLSRGHHRIYVHGKDANGNWGAYDYIDIYIFASKFKVYGWVNDSSGNPLKDIAVNITDKTTGENVTVYTDANGYYEYYIDQLPHAYSIGDKILVYADDGSDAGAIDGTYYDTNSTNINSAPGSAKLNLQLTTPVPEFNIYIILLLLGCAAPIYRKTYL